jgi:uncharacterized membrane protein
MFTKFKNITPQVLFIYAANLFSIVFNIVTPPLQAPDEFNHFYRAYQLAEGQFLPNKTDNRLGGEIPNCINEFVFPFDNAATELRLTLTQKDIFNGFSIKQKKNTTQFKDFPHPSYYSIISYLPQVAAIFITKQLNCSVGTMYYAGRILSFLVWLLCMFFVIKIVPIYKWLFTIFCLLPMNIYITNSFSADTVSNVLSFLFIALILKHTFSEKQFRFKDFLLLLVIIALLALAKVVYIMLILSFFIIPIIKFKKRAHYFLYAGTLFFVAFIFASYWSGIVMKYYTPYANYNPSHRDWICLTSNSNYYEQKEYILSHNTYFLKVIYHSIFNHPSTYLEGYIGLFGNSDIPLPKWLFVLSYVVIVFMSLFENNKFTLTILQKTILVGASFCAFVLLLLSQHLTWDAVGEGIVDLVQGRYLIPIFPFLFLAIGNYKLKANISYGIILISLFAILYSISAYEIINRYYVGKCIQKEEFTCDAESVNAEGLFSTSNPKIFLQVGGVKTDSVAYNGKSSLLLSEQAPYGFTYKFNDLSYGDLLEVSLWQKGQGAVLVLSGDGDNNCKKTYFPSNTIHYYDKKSWGRLYIKLVIPECKNTNLSFYVWNPTKTKICVDDLTFSIKKFAQ